MGGLRKYMPITAATFIVGWLAIAGVPPFAGLLVEGRDPALRLRREPGALGPRPRHRAAHRLLHEPPGVPGLLRRGALAARPRTGHEPVEPHESPWLMTVPARGPGRPRRRRRLLNLPVHRRPPLPRALARAGARRQRGASSTSPPARRSASRSSPCWPRSSASPSPRASTSRSASSRSSPSPRRGLVLRQHHRRVRGRPRPAGLRGRRRPSTHEVVDGAVNGVAAVVRGGGRGLRVLQTGFVRSYALGVAVGVVGLLAYFLTRAASDERASSSPARRRTASPRSPLTAAIVAAVPRRARRRADPDGPRRAAPAGRPAVRHRHRRHHRSGCSPTSTPTTPASSSR